MIKKVTIKLIKIINFLLLLKFLKNNFINIEINI
jgi:hypothetical protein